MQNVATINRTGRNHRVVTLAKSTSGKRPKMSHEAKIATVMLLSRIIDIRGSRESETSADDDREWHSEVMLEIGPHPDLSETQKKVIALDYGMRGGKAKIMVRRALLYYALKRLGLDTDPGVRRPQDQQIILLNSLEVIGGSR